MDGHKHMIRIDFSDMAVAMHLVAATTALFDELYAHPRKKLMLKIIMKSYFALYYDINLLLDLLFPINSPFGRPAQNNPSIDATFITVPPVSDISSIAMVVPFITPI